jgi:hypothetical protein
MPLTNHGRQLFIGVSLGLRKLPKYFEVALTNEHFERGFSEPEGGYKRIKVGVGDKHWKMNQYHFTNVKELKFPQASEDWGNIRNWVLLDDEDKVIGWSRMAMPRPVKKGKSYGFRPGSLILMLEEKI